MDEGKGEEASSQEDASKVEVRPMRMRDRDGDAAACPICLEVIEDSAMVSSCFHCFCFLCIRQWSEVNPSCPLCKAPIVSLISAIKSDTEFTEVFLDAPLTSKTSAASSGSSRRQARQTIEWGRRPSGGVASVRPAVVQRRRRVYLRRLVPRPLSPSKISSRRRVVHASCLPQPAAAPASTGSVGSKGGCATTAAPVICTPEVWEARGRQWVERDLRCLLEEEDVTMLVMIFESLLLRAGGDLRSPVVKEEWEGFLGRHCGVFLRELTCFVATPFDMRTYDREVKYVDLLAIAARQ